MTQNEPMDDRTKPSIKEDIPRPIVKTSLGHVRGAIQNGRLAFYGVPYAEPPLGPECRFRPPIAKEPWQGVLDADRFGYAACQPGVLDYQPRQSEDCLTLNVWTPATDGPLRPVLLFVHGGGFTGGSGSDPAHHGGTFADSGVVAITVNYRLGALGFLDLGSALGEEYRSSGNCGLLDLIEALRWTKAHISAFGGDPDRITIMGQSAGAKCVCALLSSPLASGLFRGVIAQSGAIQSIRDSATSNAVTGQYLQKLGLQRHDAQSLLNLPVKDLMDAQNALSRDFAGVHLFGPVMDGIVIVSPPLSFLSQHPHPMPALLIGTNRNETSNLAVGTPIGGAGPDGLLARMFGDNAPIVEAAYNRRSGRTLQHEHPDMPAWQSVLTDYMYRIAAARTADAYSRAGADMWMYSFEREGIFGAAHGDEMAFVFGRAEESEDDRKLAATLHGAWLSFIRGGDPQTADTGSWPRFDGQERTVMRFDSSGCKRVRSDTQDDPSFPDQAYLVAGSSQGR